MNKINCTATIFGLYRVDEFLPLDLGLIEAAQQRVEFVMQPLETLVDGGHRLTLATRGCQEMNI